MTELLRDRAYVGGDWIPTDATFPVTDPATGEEVARVPRCGEAETRAAIASAERTSFSWRSRNRMYAPSKASTCGGSDAPWGASNARHAASFLGSSET